MLFNSFEFLIFFPVVVLVYLIIPRKFRTIWLLVSSYYFYMSWNPKYAILIGLSTVTTFCCGILTEQAKSTKTKKVIIALCMVINLAILFVFKYANFALSTLNSLCMRFGVTFTNKRLDILLPVGISFYTFQAIGYTVDVYRKRIDAEKNIISYALFVSFFPQLVAGPIERSKNLLDQIRRVNEEKLFDYDRIMEGLFLMLWGLFQKLVIADRASILVNCVYNDYTDYGFVELSIASILFAFQIYCDFGGYTNIAVGAAKVMGFSLMENFRQPYLAISIKDFWRRWHISLTSWFTDYLYIPLGGSHRGTLKHYFNIVVVFLASGLWHGASWHFVAWGGIHAIYQIIGNVKNKIMDNLTMRKGKNVDSISFSYRIRKMVGTFILVDFAWIFFAADSLYAALEIIRQMFVKPISSSIYDLGLDVVNWRALFFSIVILITVDAAHEKGISIMKWVNGQETWFRVIVWLALVWTIIMLGIYGSEYDTSQFIYFQF